MNSRVPLAKIRGKFWKLVEMSDQARLKRQEASIRLLGRHWDSLRGNFKMQLHIGSFFAKIPFLAQAYTLGKFGSERNSNFRFSLRELLSCRNLKDLVEPWYCFKSVTSESTEKFEYFSILDPKQQVRSVRNMLVEPTTRFEKAVASIIGPYISATMKGWY